MAAISDSETNGVQASQNLHPAIDIRYLRVDYGDFRAVDDLTLEVPAGVEQNAHRTVVDGLDAHRLTEYATLDGDAAGGQ